MKKSAEERKACQRAWSKAKYTERAEAGQCLRCGADEAGAGPSGKCCAPCLEKRRNGQAKEKAERAAKKWEAQNAQGANAQGEPVCSHCLSRDVIRRGRPRGIQRYSCRTCGRFSQGFAPTPRPLYRCPYCRTGTCYNLGKAAHQEYQCRDCGRRSTALLPGEARDASEPKYTHEKTFCLGPRAAQGLSAFTRRTQMSVAQAIRAILRREAVNPTRRWASAQVTGSDAWHGVQVRVSSTMVAGGPTCEIADADIAAPLPNLQSQWVARRLQQENYQTYCPVAVVEEIRVSFGDTAKRGLLRVMRSRGLNHQEAMRFLLAAEIRAPVKPPLPVRRIHPWQRRRKPQLKAGETEAGGEFDFQSPL